uniref:Uncharacterized protein n=1 Tax=Arundo donax TaxID=35708 RepID=A0A0A9GQA2_ARUDO
MYPRTSFQEPPHRCFRHSFSSCFISLNMVLSWHISNAASSGSDNAKFGAKFAGLLKNVHVASRVARSFGSRL